MAALSASSSVFGQHLLREISGFLAAKRSTVHQLVINCVRLLFGCGHWDFRAFSLKTAACQWEQKY